MTRSTTLALCIAATACAQSPTPTHRREVRIDESAPARPSEPPATSADAPPRPHEFGAARLFSTKTDVGMRPDYVLIRVTAGGAHGDEELPQPVLHVQFIAAREEGSTSCRAERGVVVVGPGGGPSAAAVGDRLLLGAELHAFEIERIDWPGDHRDQPVRGPMTLAFVSETGRPTDFNLVYDVDRAGKDAVDLTFRCTTKSKSVVLHEVPETTVRVKYGQVVVFPTRRPASETK